MKHFNNLHKLFRAFTLLFIMGIWAGNSYAQINVPIGTPYTENFNAATANALPTGWTVIDVGNNASTTTVQGKWTTFATLSQGGANVAFGGTGNCMGYAYQTANPGNDWAITPSFNFVTGQTYRMTFKYSATADAQATYPEKLKIFLGSAATVAGMTTQIQDYPNINVATYSDASFTFTVATTGVYFVGFYCYSDADQFALRVDDVAITALATNDVAYNSITTTAVATNCSSFTATTPINIQIANGGTANQTNVQVNYSVTRDGSAFMSGNVTVPTINSGTTASASFNLDMTLGGSYVVSVTTALGTDQVAGNNTGSVTILNPFVDLTATGASYLQTFETATTSPANVGWSSLDANTDNITWGLVLNAPFTNQVNPGSKAIFSQRSQSVASNDWIFSNCIKLKGATTYSVSYYRRGVVNGTSEKLKFSYGTAQTAAGMTNLIQDYGTFTVTDQFTLITHTFTTPAGDNTYYFGFQNYGDAINAPATPAPPASNNGIIIDDFYVVNPAANDLAVTNATTAVNTCSMTNATPVTITFANAGTAAFASTFTWEVRNAVTNAVLATSPNPVAVSSIAVGATGTVSVNYDFSTPGTIYSVKITLANDGTNTNNERTFVFANARRDLSANNSTYFENLDGVAGGLGWSNINGNADNSAWSVGNNVTLASSGAGYFFILNPTTGNANDALFTPCLTLKAGKVYNISFKYRTNDIGQNLSLILTNVNNTATPTEIQTIQTYPSLLSNLVYTTSANLSFFVPLASGDGTYYIAFKTTMPSAGTTQAIRIDDITITNTGVDAIPPVTPTTFTATSTNAFVADLTWTAPAGVTSYILERSLMAGSGFQPVTPAPAMAATTYQETGLVGGTTYFYRLTAVNQFGNSTPATAQVTILSPPAPVLNAPTSPSILTINLSWADLANETGYIVERSTAPGTGFAQIGSNLAVNVVTYQDQGGLNAGTTYYYRVRGIYAGGNSAPSNEENIMPMAPTPVGLPTAVAGTNATALTITVNWTNIATATGYTIQRSTTSGSGYQTIASVGAGVITYLDNNNLIGGTTYYYVIVANYTLGNAVASPQASAIAVNPPVPTAPAITTNNITAIAVTINWGDVNFETSYDIERADGANATTGFAVVGSVNANVVTFTNTGLTPNTSYTYRVVAKNIAGNSPYSNTANVLTLNVPVPVAPNNLTAVYSVTSPFAISLAWGDVTGEDSYLIERKTGTAGTFAQIGTTSANIVGYVDNNLTANTTYFYRVKAKNVSGDSPASNEASATVLSIENNAISQQTALFPNPTNGEFVVKLPNMKIRQATFNLVDAQGRKVFTSTKENDNADQFDFQLMNLPKGVYMLHIDTPKGQAVKRVVIK
jgi:hypothetical protein